MLALFYSLVCGYWSATVVAGRTSPAIPLRMRAASTSPEPGQPPRTLVIVPAGDKSLHETLLFNRSSAVTLCVLYYGQDASTADLFARTADYFHHLQPPRPKFPAIRHALLNNYCGLSLHAYSYFFLPDDDLYFDQLGSINRFVASAHALHLLLSQPALLTTEHSAMSGLRQLAGCGTAHHTSFVEIQAPLVHHSVFLTLIFPVLNHSHVTLGWGVDVVWAHLLRQRVGRADAVGVIDAMGVIDATPIHHVPKPGRTYNVRQAQIEARATAKLYNVSMRNSRQDSSPLCVAP